MRLRSGLPGLLAWGVLAALTALSLTGCQSGAATHLMVPARVNSAVDIGAYVATRPITLVMGVKTHDQALLDQTISQSRTDRARALTPSDFADRFAVAADTYAQLIDWAGANHLHVDRATPGRTTLTVSGAVADIERAFNLHLRLFQDANGIFYAPDHDPDLTSGVLDNVSSVVGFTNAGRWWSHRRHRPANTYPTPPLPQNGYGYADLRTLYDAPADKLGEGERIAILGVGAPELEADTLPSGTDSSWNEPQLADITQYLGVASPSPLLYTQVQVGASSAADPGDDDTLGENTLDAEMVLTFAPKAHVDHVLVVDNAYGLFSDGISFIVNDPVESTAHAVSLSYGSCETGDPSQFPIINALLAQARAEGQQWFVAAGDGGTDDCGDGPTDPVLTVDWPGSSPYALSVGGTQIDGKGTTKKPFSTTVWGDNTWDDGGGGGGASQAFPKPSWQVGTTPADGARDVPDISALAANPGIDEIQTGTDDPSYGTSCAAPMWAGIWAVVDQASNNGKGFTTGGENLYLHAPAGGIVDVNPTTPGSNAVGTPAGGYSTGPGYDQATGLGEPDVSKLTLQTGWK